MPPHTGARDGGAPPPDPDLEQFVESYREHERRVYGLCYAYLKNAAAAEDAAQETFIRATARLVGMEERLVGRYLLLVARSICIDELRRRSTLSSAHERLGSEEQPADPELRVVDAELVRRIWGRLGERERAIFVCRFAGYSYDEIGARLGMSGSAVGVALLRARRHARRILEGAGGLLTGGWARRVRHAQLRRALRQGSGRSVRRLAALRRWGGRSLLLLVTAGAGSGVGLAMTHGLGATPAAQVIGPAVPPVDAAGQQVVVGVTASPAFLRDRTLFASAHLAAGCHGGLCPVLLVSHDGGHRWQPLPATGFAGGELLLPPAYPRIPTLFAAGPQGLQESDDAGASFRTVVSLPGPAAILPAVAGSRTLHVMVGAVPLWAYDAAASRLDAGPSLPQGITGIQDLRALDDGALLITASRAGTAGVDRPDHVVLRCEGRACHTVLVVHDGPPLRLATAASSVVAAFSPTTLVVSGDGGRSFRSVHVGGGQVLAAAVAPGARVLALLGGGAGASLVTVDAAGRLVAVMPDVSAPPRALWMTALPDGRLLAAASLPQAGAPSGLRCSADGGEQWTEC